MGLRSGANPTEPVHWTDRMCGCDPFNKRVMSVEYSNKIIVCQPQVTLRLSHIPACYSHTTEDKPIVTLTEHGHNLIAIQPTPLSECGLELRKKRAKKSPETRNFSIGQVAE